MSRNQRFQVPPGSISYNMAMHNKENINQLNRSEQTVNLGNPITGNNATRADVAELLYKTAPNSLMKSNRFKNVYRRKQQQGALRAGRSRNLLPAKRSLSSITTSNHNGNIPQPELRTESRPVVSYPQSSKTTNQQIEIEDQTSDFQQSVLNDVSITKSSNGNGSAVPPTNDESDDGTSDDCKWTCDEKEWFDNNVSVLTKYSNEEKKPNKTKSKIDNFNPKVCCVSLMQLFNNSYHLN